MNKIIFRLGSVALPAVSFWLDILRLKTRAASASTFNPYTMLWAAVLSNLVFVGLLVLLVWNFTRYRESRVLSAIIAAVGALLVLWTVPFILPSAILNLVRIPLSPGPYLSLAGSLFIVIGLAGLFVPAHRPESPTIN